MRCVFSYFDKVKMEGNKSAYFTNKIVKVTIKRIKITPLLVRSYQKEKYDKLNPNQHHNRVYWYKKQIHSIF